MQPCTAVLTILMLVAGMPSIEAPCAQAQAPEVRNIQSMRDGDVVTITYDLRKENEQTYIVWFLLSTDGGETYDVEPQAVSGVVGPGVPPGSGKRITWRIREEYPEGLSGLVQYRIVVEGGRRGQWGSSVTSDVSGFAVENSDDTATLTVGDENEACNHQYAHH